MGESTTSGVGVMVIIGNLSGVIVNDIVGVAVGATLAPTELETRKNIDRPSNRSAKSQPAREIVSFDWDGFLEENKVVFKLLHTKVQAGKLANRPTQGKIQSLPVIRHQAYSEILY